MIDLSIVIPVFNNQDTLTELVERLDNLLTTQTTFEIIFANDASKDNSLQIIQELSTRYPFVRLKNIKKNIGQNKALIEGFKEASGKKVMVMDADLQDNLDMVLPLLKKLDSKTDAVFILREGKYQSTNRMITSYLLKGVIQLITGLPKKAGTFFIVQNSMVQKVLKLKCSFPYVTIMVFHVCSTVTYLQSSRKSNFGKSSYTFKKRLLHAVRAIQCTLQCRFLN